METRDLSKEEKLDILKPKKRENCSNCSDNWVKLKQHFGIPWKRKKPLGALRIRHWTRKTRKTTAGCDRTIVIIVKRKTQNNSQWPPTRSEVNASQPTIWRRLWEKYKCHQKARLEFKKYKNAPQNPGTKMKLYQSDRKANLWENKGSAHDPKHASSSVKVWSW